MLKNNFDLSLGLEFILQLGILSRGHLDPSLKVETRPFVIFVWNRTSTSQSYFITRLDYHLWLCFCYLFPIGFLNLYLLLWAITVTCIAPIKDNRGGHWLWLVSLLQRVSIILCIQRFINRNMLCNLILHLALTGLSQILLFEIIVLFHLDHHRTPHHHIEILVDFR